MHLPMIPCFLELAKTSLRMFEPHMSYPVGVIFQMFWSCWISCNCTTFQVVQVAASITLQNYQWATGYLRTPSPRVPFRLCASKVSTEIKFFSTKGHTYLTSFNSRINPSNNLTRTVLSLQSWHVCPLPNNTKPPSSVSKLANHYHLRQTCKVSPVLVAVQRILSGF